MTDERDDDTKDIAERLRARQPALGAERRLQLRAHLLGLPQFPSRPAHLWLLIGVLALSGLVLLALAATQV